MSWTTVRVASNLDVVIPEKIKDICDYYADKIREEFAILTNISKEKNGVVTLSEDFYIPKQTVSTAYITINPEDTNVGKYNAIIHRHPDGMHSFSKTDEENINLNFKCSFLYTKSAGFVKGIYNVDVHQGIMTRLDFNLKADYSERTSIIHTYGPSNSSSYFDDDYKYIDDAKNTNDYKNFQNKCSSLWVLHPYFKDIKINNLETKKVITDLNEAIEQLHYLVIYKNSEFMVRNLDKINNYVDDVVNSFNIIKNSNEIDINNSEFTRLSNLIDELNEEWYELVDISDSNDDSKLNELEDDIANLELRIDHIEEYLALNEDQQKKV